MRENYSNTKNGIVFGDRDFTKIGEEIIDKLYNNLRWDIERSEDSKLDKKEALESLDNFVESYKLEKIRRSN